MSLGDQEKVGLPRAVELARQTYQEVLDAIKHQDDKINRFLVAIAFLTTGGVAYVLKGELLRVRYVYGSHGVPLIAIAAIIYLAATITSVVLLLMALSTELDLPGAKPMDSEDVKLDDSLLYFHMIGGQPLRSWFKRWDAPVPALEATLRGNYLREAHNLSERARVKYALTNEASAVYVYALMWLAVGLLVGTYQSQVSSAPLLESSLALWPLLITGAVFAIHAVLQLHHVYSQEQSSPDVEWHLAAYRVRRNKVNQPKCMDSGVNLGHCELRRREHDLSVVDLDNLVVVVTECAASLAKPAKKGEIDVPPVRICGLKQAADEGEQLDRALRALTRLMLCVPLYILCVLATAVTQGWGALPWWVGVCVSTGLIICSSWQRIGADRMTRRLFWGILGGAILVAIGLPAVSASLGLSWGAVAAAAGPATLLSLFTAVRQFHKGRKRRRRTDEQMIDRSALQTLLVPWVGGPWPAPETPSIRSVDQERLD